MKRIPFFFAVMALAAVVLSSSTVFAQKSFEGAIVWQVIAPQSGNSDPHELTMDIKGQQTFMETDMGMQGKIHIYQDAIKKKRVIVLVDRDMGMEQDMTDEVPTAAQIKAAKEQLKATGQKKTIRGHAAELFEFTDGKETVGFWMTKDIPTEIREGLQSSLSSSFRGTGSQKSAMEDLVKQGYFPVRIDTKDGGSMELVSITPKSIPDSTFAVPTDIMIRKMPAGMMHGRQ